MSVGSWRPALPFLASPERGPGRGPRPFCDWGLSSRLQVQLLPCDAGNPRQVTRLNRLRAAIRRVESGWRPAERSQQMSPGVPSGLQEDSWGGFK